MGGIVVLGLLSLAGYAWLALVFPAAGTARDVWSMIVLLWGQFAVLFFAWRWLRRVRWQRGVIVWLLGFAALFRLVMVFAGIGPVSSWGALLRDAGDDLRGRAVVYDTFLLYDNDVWRYLWDGHVAAHGLDPYRLTPQIVAARAEEDDPRFTPLLASPLWSDLFDNLSYGTYRSVYPPLSQYLFRGLHAVAPGSVLATKLFLAAIDWVTCLLIWTLLRRCGCRPTDVVLYAWNPLAIKEIAGSGHVDAVVIALTVALLLWLVEGRAMRAWMALAAAVMAKLVPLTLVGLVAVRTAPRQWLWGLVAGIGLALPMAGGLGSWVAGMGAFARDWQFFPGIWALARWVAMRTGVAEPSRWASAFGVLLLVSTVVLATRYVLRARDQGRDVQRALLRAAFVILAALPLTSAAVMPWYLLWALPAAIVVGCWSWHGLLASSLLSYQIYIHQREAVWTLVVGHGVFVAVAVWEWSRWRQMQKSARGR